MSLVLSVLAKAVEADEEAAAELMDQIAMEIIAKEVEEHGAELDQLVLPWMSEQVAKAKRGLIRGYVSKTVEGTYPDETYARVAKQLEALTEVIKDNDAQQDFAQRARAGGVRRDERGRFSRYISGHKVSSVEHLGDHQLSPTNRALRDQGKNPDSDPDAKDALLREQGEWDEVQNTMKDFLNTFPGSGRDVDAVLHVRAPSGESKEIRVPLSKPLDAKRMQLAGYGLDDKVHAVEIAPASNAGDRTKERVARYNSVAGQTGSTTAARLFASYDPSTAAAARTMFGVDDQEHQRSGLKRFFGRTQAAGNVLEGINGAEKYGRMIRLAGEMGSEADAALGPAAQRAAYRYRGTEKEADPTLRRAFSSRDMHLVDRVGEADDPTTRAEIAGDIGTRASQRGGVGPVLGSLRYRLAESQRSPEPMLGDELAMKVRSDVAAEHMMGTLPDDPLAAELSIRSGHVLPSQGVIIDADGDVVSQAVGFGEDHYLPFDLKNIRRLKGGQYVRTRMEGGPTGEDVYALVASGARMGTVVSSSGVFTLEMDPNFRGRRKSSDKARLVYQRYLEILDAVEGSGLYTRDLPAADKARVDEQARALGYKPDTTEYEGLVDAERRRQTKLSPDQIEQIEADARQELQTTGRGFSQLSSSQQNAAVGELTQDRIEEAKTNLVRQVGLNADGYALAMKTLQQQFPYYIRTASYEPLNDKEKGGGFFAHRGMDTGPAIRQRSHTRDRGYVRPGGLRTESTAEGFYRTPGGRRLKSDKPKGAEPAAAAPAASAPAAASAPGTTAPSAGETQTTTPSAPLVDALANRRAEFTNRRDEAASDLRVAWAAVGQSGIPSSGATATPWEDAKKRPALAATWLLDADPAQFNEAITSDQNGVLNVLSNREVMADAAKKHAGGSQSVGYGDSQLMASLKLPGVTDAESFAHYVADTAQRVVDYQQLANPNFFRAGGSGTQWETSGPPVVSDLATITTQAGLDTYAKQHPETAALAKQIGLAGDRPRRFSDMQADVAGRLKAIKPFTNWQATVQGAYNPSMSVEQAQERAVSQKLSEAGTDLEGLGRAVGRKFSNAAQVSEWAQGPGADRTAMDVQHAWSLAAYSRLVDAVEGGDLVPKDQPALARLAKAAPLPPRVAVLPPTDPRSLVAKQLAEGRPLPRAFRPQRG